MITLSVIDKILKEVYIPAVREQMKRGSILLSEVQRTADTIDSTGKYAVMALMLGLPEGIGARGELEDLPVAGSSRYDRVTVSVKNLYATFEISGNVLRQARGEGSFIARILDSEMRNLQDNFIRDINRQLYGDGTGRLATITAASTGTTITVNTTQYLAIGMRIDIYDSTLTTLKGTRRITAIPTDTSITVDSAITVAVNDVIIRNNSLNKELTGLERIVGTGVYLLDPTVVPEWRASVITLPANYTAIDILNCLQRAYTACEKKNTAPNLAITTYEIRDTYAQCLTTMRKLVNVRQLNFGFKGIEFNDLAIVPDDQCPARVLYMLNTKNLIIHEASDVDWADEDGHILSKIPNKDAYRGYMYYSGEFSTDRRNAHAKVIGW